MIKQTNFLLNYYYYYYCKETIEYIIADNKNYCKTNYILVLAQDKHKHS